MIAAYLLPTKFNLNFAVNIAPTALAGLAMRAITSKTTTIIQG